MEGYCNECGTAIINDGTTAICPACGSDWISIGGEE
jgi:Zn finger protein HypA/HybF involved in hydrogenase expression